MVKKILRGKLWFLVVATWLLLTPMTILAGEKCPLCNKEPRASLFLVTLEDGKQVAYSCLGCALIALGPEKLAKVKAQAMDFMSRTLVDASKAFYVKDSSYKECCFYWFAFASKEHAMSYAKGFGGEVLTFKQALKTAEE